MLELNKDNFQKEVLESSVPVLVDFWATWCGPCQMMLPIVGELAQELVDQPYKVGKINVDEEADLAQKYDIMSVPTFIVFKGGVEVERVHGGQSKAKLLEILKK